MKNHIYLTKAMVEDMLKTADNWKGGGHVNFSYRFPRGFLWDFKVTREEDRYAPFKFLLSGRQREKPELGVHPSWARRYVSIERLLVHLGNHLNENVNVDNRYKNIQEWLDDGEGLA